MSFDMTTYKRISGQLDLEGIDFDAFREAPLAPSTSGKVQVVAVRQTPSATAASATYSATSGPTRGSNTDGTM